MPANLDLFGNETVENTPVSREIVRAGLERILLGISSERLAAILYSQVEAVIDFARLCRGQKAGRLISLLFNPHRLGTATLRSKSLISALQSADTVSGIARAIAWQDGKYPVRDALYRAIEVGANGVQYVNEFPPSIARDIFTSFGATRILDPCAGWGGRMIGAASVGAFYHGFEPSSKTHSGLIKLGEFLKQFNTGFDFIVENLPFEDAKLTERYTLAMTSPPYFDTERYSDEQTQAAIKWPSFASFAGGFFIPMIEKAIASADGGLVLNIGSRTYPMKQTMLAAFPDARKLTQFQLSAGAGVRNNDVEGESFYLIRSG
mgnify:FL=1